MLFVHESRDEEHSIIIGKPSNLQSVNPRPNNCERHNLFGYTYGLRHGDQYKWCGLSKRGKDSRPSNLLTGRSF